MRRSQQLSKVAKITAINGGRSSLDTMVLSSLFLKDAATPIGQVDVHPTASLAHPPTHFRISSFTTFHNKHCSPLAALQAAAPPASHCFTMQCNDQAAPLIPIYTTCLTDAQTAVIHEERDDIHLVPMKSRIQPTGNTPTTASFWGFKVSRSLFSTFLTMLKQRSLAIIFNLDSTLIVTNTVSTFKEHIDSSRHKISSETDPLRVSAIMAEIESYRQDLFILEQYAEHDQVVDNGKIHKAQLEEVPRLQQHLSKTQPVIRLSDKGIILTRIDPSKRDTSVLVKIRPGWEETRNFLAPTRDQRSFDIYVCTRADPDLAIELWRLLDPKYELISSSQLHRQVMCLKDNSRKSLQDIFHYRQCHPKMALVIDNRLDVWDEKDQPRVHVVPTFSPYAATQEEPHDTLLDVRNVASNVHRGFFRDFDSVFLPQIDEVFFEDQYTDLPSAPDVGNYLTSVGVIKSLVEENNGSEDVYISQRCGDGSNLVLVPVSLGSSGKGLPYAPENWPKKGDVWTWRVGLRVARSGHCMDRYLCPPEQYTKGRLVLSSRLSVEEFVKKEFPGVDISSFFASFSWKIPCRGQGSTGSYKENLTITGFPGTLPKVDSPEPEPRPESPIPEGLCMARNKTCKTQKEFMEQSEIKSESEPFPCDICCSEPGFCRDCCCILCSKAVDWKHNSHTFIRCMATVGGSHICGHGAHIKCALRCFMAGTVGGSIGLDAEYYCRRCDNKMDLVLHVADYCRACRSISSKVEVESILNLGLSALSGSNRAIARKLHSHIGSSLSKIKHGASLDEIFTEDWISLIDISAETLHEEDHSKRDSFIDLNFLHALPCKRKGHNDDNMTTRPSKRQDSSQNGSTPNSPSLSFNSPQEAEKEVSRVLLELEKLQECKVVEEKLRSQKDHLFGLYWSLKAEKADLDDPIVRQFNDAETYNALVARINARADEVEEEEKKLQHMLKVVEKYVQSHKMLTEHFVDVGSDKKTLIS